MVPLDPEEGPYRRFSWRARCVLLESENAALRAQVAKLTRPPLRRRIAAHPFFQGLCHFATLIATFAIGVLLVLGCVAILCLFEAGCFYTVTVGVDAAIAAHYPVGVPPPRFSQPEYPDASTIAGAIFPPKID